MNILGFCGKKASGKDTCALFIFGSYLSALGIVKGGYTVNTEGLFVTDIFGDASFKGRFDPRRNTDVMRVFLKEYVDPYVKLYSFADDLKKFCINVLGLKYEQCYGSNEEKNSLTHLRWEDMPSVCTDQELCNDIQINAHGGILKSYFSEKIIKHTVGQMTAREVMQYFGTNIVRKMYGPAWAKSTLKRIKEDEPLLAVITDCRFEDEVDEINIAEGKVIGLTRKPYNDEHESEQITIDSEKFAAVIDNAGLSIDEQNDRLVEILRAWEFLPEINMVG
jgi:hypothetical protein